jgi:hypothetical protein
MLQALLQTLSFAGNRLTGTIPKYLGTFTALRNLYMHTNLLAGDICQESWEI